MGKRIEKLKIIIVAAIIILAGFGFAQNALANYHATGTLISTNLLEGIPNDSIDSFFASSTQASGTSLWVQFATTSADEGPWYDASSTPGATTSIPVGQQTIPLSGAITSGGANFYYKIQFNSDGSNTPVLTQIRVNYTADTYITPTTYYNLV